MSCSNEELLSTDPFLYSNSFSFESDQNAIKSPDGSINRMSKCTVFRSKEQSMNDTFFSHETTNKENSSSQRFYDGDFSFSTNTEFFPSTFLITNQICRGRFPLEGQDPNSQDRKYCLLWPGNPSENCKSVESNYEPHWHSTDNDVLSKCDHDSTLNKTVTSTCHCKQQQVQTFFDSDLKKEGSERTCTLPTVGSLLTWVQSSNEFGKSLSEKQTHEKNAEEKMLKSFLKRRKSNIKLITTLRKTNVKMQRSFSETEISIKNALQRATSDSNLIGDFSKNFILPLKIGKHTDLKNIDCHTLAKLMNGEYSHTVYSYTIIDCRYPYEYEGGHIRGAINIYTRERMLEELNQKKCVQKLDTEDSHKRSILIFHCEFSSERGPSLSRYLRNADREKNSLHYPKLDYPEIYLLCGGYSNFFKHYKELCEPCHYLPMNDPKYSAELRALKTRSKSWTCINGNHKLRSSYLKRLNI